MDGVADGQFQATCQGDGPLLTGNGPPGFFASPLHRIRHNSVVFVVGIFHGTDRSHAVGAGLCRRLGLADLAERQAGGLGRRIVDVGECAVMDCRFNGVFPACSSA